MKKFEFTEETKIVFGITLHRIKALTSFGIVEAGALGGWLEKESNLSHIGDAWVYDNALVYGNAQVCGDAQVYDDAQVCGDARVYGNAQVYGNARVCDNARVFGDALVCGDAQVCGNARVCGDAVIQRCEDYLTVSPIGSRRDITTFFRDEDGKIHVKCGCFLGDIDEFASAVTKTHGENKHAKAYQLAIQLAKECICAQEG